MKDIQKRRKLMIDLLINSEDYLTVKKISSLFGVSERTVHNDLDYLQSKYEIIKKSGVGIRLVSSNNLIDTEISVNDRRLDIIKKIILESKTVTINELKEQYYVSQSSILNDLKWIKNNFLQSYNANLLSSEKGTRVICSENERIKILVSYSNLAINLDQTMFQREEMLRKFSLIYPKNICEACWHVIESFRHEQFLQKAEYYLQNVYRFLLALVYRLQLGNHLVAENKNELHTMQVMELTNYLLAHDVFNLINENLDNKVIPTEEDVLYLSMLLRANKISFLKSANGIDDYSKQFASSLIEKMSEVIEIDLTGNLQLIEMIYSHCNAMFERIKNKVKLENPMLQIIKQEYQAMFELVWLIVDAIDHNISKNISEDEIGFLMLYFQNEMEKNKKSKKIIVVCPNGVVASNLIASKIKEFLPPMDIIEVTSIDRIEKNDISGYSFIVSTTALDEQVIPVIQVSMLLTIQDINNIKDMYEDISECKKGANTSVSRLKTQYLAEEDIFWSNKSLTREDVIYEVCQKLISSGRVKNGFCESVLTREKISSTSISTGGAIPHASCKYVNHTCFALYVSSKPIEWGDYSVKVIIFFALAESDVVDSKRILSEAFNFIREQIVVDTLSSVSSRDELLELLCIGGKHD